MWPYWLLFALPAGAAVLESARTRAAVHGRSWGVGWALMWVVLAAMVGLRHEVGGDWFNYLPFLLRVRDLDLREALTYGEPAYQFLNWLFASSEIGIYFVNSVSGAIFATGLVIFCRSLPHAWLAMAVAIPYLVIVVAMGYSRQGIALSMAMIGIVALNKGSTPRFVAWVVGAALFHKSALLLIPIAALASARNRYWAAAWVSATMAGLYVFLLADDVEQLYTNYVVAEYQSQGALIRLAMNAVAAVTFLLFRKRFALPREQSALWMAFSALSLILLGLLFVSNASTAIDRIALYLLPLQLVVAGHAPVVFGGSSLAEPAAAPQRRRKARSRGDHREIVVLAVLAYYAVVQFVWLNFATHAFAWLPYRFYPLETGV